MPAMPRMTGPRDLAASDQFRGFLIAQSLAVMAAIGLDVQSFNPRDRIFETRLDQAQPGGELLIAHVVIGRLAAGRLSPLAPGAVFTRVPSSDDLTPSEVMWLMRVHSW